MDVNTYNMAVRCDSKEFQFFIAEKRESVLISEKRKKTMKNLMPYFK